MGQYAVITANYWAFTLTDGALRMLVVLYFHGLGYSALDIAFLFIFYELFGVITNLLGGWLGARLGLNRTMQLGLGLQIVALALLLVPPQALSVALVMVAQALSGIAKDLNKMSAKSAVKMLLPENASGRLYRLVAFLTGSKNTLKGAGFFLGGALLSGLGFRGAILVLLGGLAMVWCLSFFLLREELGKSKQGPKFSSLLSKSRAINVLSGARFFLFAARDVWFVVALPLHLATVFGWEPIKVSGFLAAWIIGYGIVQALAPTLTGANATTVERRSTLALWALALAIVTGGLALLPAVQPVELMAEAGQSSRWTLLVGLMVFAAVFAINSSLHSFYIVRYASTDGVSLDVGFYYMANAGGRLVGTLLSGWLTLAYGLTACLFVAAVLLLFAAAISLALPPLERVP